MIDKNKNEDRGSLTILTTSLFFLLVLTSFVILNASSAYLAKRELIQIGEVAAAHAVQNLDSNSYYGSSYGINFQSLDSPIQIGNLGMSSSAQYSGTWGYSTNGEIVGSRLPIDCQAAAASFTNELSHSHLRQNAITVTRWVCDGTSISSEISSQVKQLLALPIIGSSAPISITAQIGAANLLQSP